MSPDQHHPDDTGIETLDDMATEIAESLRAAAYGIAEAEIINAAVTSPERIIVVTTLGLREYTVTIRRTA